jgi:hypothetical protein
VSSQAFQIIFEVQSQRTTQKRAIRKYISLNWKTCFFSFGPLLFSNLIIFFLLIHFKQFKMLYQRHLKFFKSFWNFYKNKATYKEFFGCLGIGLCNAWWFSFCVLHPLYFRGHNFLNSILFLTIIYAPIGEVQVCFGQQKQQNPPLGCGPPWSFKCSITSWFTLYPTFSFLGHDVGGKEY